MPRHLYLTNSSSYIMAMSWSNHFSEHLFFPVNIISFHREHSFSPGQRWVLNGRGNEAQRRICQRLNHTAFYTSIRYWVAQFEIHCMTGKKGQCQCTVLNRTMYEALNSSRPHVAWHNSQYIVGNVLLQTIIIALEELHFGVWERSNKPIECHEIIYYWWRSYGAWMGQEWVTYIKGKIFICHDTVHGITRAGKESLQAPGSVRCMMCKVN